jgi:hypothetical protein
VPHGFVLQPSGRLGGTASAPDPATFTVGVTDADGELATRKSPTPRLGDIKHDGPVDCPDKDILMSQWDRSGPELSGDLNHDETVGTTDLSIMLSNWTGGSSAC